MTCIYETKHGRRYRLFNETSFQELTKPRKATFLRSPVAKGEIVAFPKPPQTIRHACADIREDDILNRKFFAAYKKTVELWEKLQKKRLETQVEEIDV